MAKKNKKKKKLLLFFVNTSRKTRDVMLITGPQVCGLNNVQQTAAGAPGGIAKSGYISSMRGCKTHSLYFWLRFGTVRLYTLVGSCVAF